MEQPGRRWSTEGTTPGKALTYWNEIVCETMLELKADSPERDRFTAELANHRLGVIDAFFISVSAQEVTRSRQDIQRSRTQLFSLVQPRRGAQFGEHRGQAVALSPGDCVFVDTAEPFHFAFPEGSECLSLLFPADWLRGWVPLPEEGAGRIFGQSTGWGRTLASALSNLGAGTVRELGLPGGVVADQIAALLALAIGPQRCASSTHKQQLMRRMKATLRENFDNPEFDPAALASILGLSRRYVHTVFAASGTTFLNELGAIRLEHARQLLQDPRLTSLGIAEIGWRCGFTAPSHFAQRFRARFGVSPREYRDCLRS